MEQVPIELNGVAPEEVSEMLGEMQEEVHDSYFEAVKLSMVEYVLKSNVEGHRLEITQPLQKFEHTTFHPSQDPSVAEAAMPKVSQTLPSDRHIPAPIPASRFSRLLISDRLCFCSRRVCLRPTTRSPSEPGMIQFSPATNRWRLASSSITTVC